MKHAIVAGMGVVLAACGGSGSSGGEPSHSPVNVAHGVYRGYTDTGSALGPLGDDEETGANGSGVQVMEKIDILSV